MFFKDVNEMNTTDREQATYIADILGDELFVTIYIGFICGYFLRKIQTKKEVIK